MELTTEDLPNGIARIVLAGRMDTAGADRIDLRFTALTTTSDAQIVVDMAQVPFVSSIGIRLLLSSAKALTRRGGRMVIASPQPLVKETLALARVDALIPVFGDLESACQALTAPG